MTSDDANNDPKDTVSTSDVTSHVSPYMKLAKVKLSYEFDEHGPKVVVSCRTCMYVASLMASCVFYWCVLLECLYCLVESLAY